MAHFARIDENNTVISVLVIPDDQEHRGQEFLADELGLGGTWLQTYYNHKIRKQYAGIGYTYEPVADVFISPKKFPSWVLNSNYDWEPPTPIPNTTQLWTWNEETVSWDESSPIELPTTGEE